MHCGHPTTSRGLPAAHAPDVHADWWNKDDHANAIDELEQAAELWRRRRVGKERGENADVWPEGGVQMHPSVLLESMLAAQRLRLLGPDVRYSHVDAIQRNLSLSKLDEYSLAVLIAVGCLAPLGRGVKQTQRPEIKSPPSGHFLVVDCRSCRA